MPQHIALVVEQEWIDWTPPLASDHLDSVGKDLQRLRAHFRSQGVPLERIGELAAVSARLARGDVQVVCVAQVLLDRARASLAAQAQTVQIVTIEELLSSGDAAPAPT